MDNWDIGIRKSFDNEKDAFQYVQCDAKIKSVEKWIKKTKFHNNPVHQKYQNLVFEYSGESGVYYLEKGRLGPRLDIELEIDQCIFAKKTIEVNIYPEVMAMIGYKRMSPKLVESIERNEGRKIEILVATSRSSIYLDVRALMSLNYGYR